MLQSGLETFSREREGKEKACVNNGRNECNDYKQNTCQNLTSAPVFPGRMSRTGTDNRG